MTDKMADVLRAVLNSDVGRQTMHKLMDGQGTETEDGKAWLTASALLGNLAAGANNLQWPQARDVARLDDMSPDHHLRVLLDNDNDVLVEVFDGRHFASVEFCNPGGGGGGQSSSTRLALIELMRAIEADNAERPGRAHPGYGQAVKTQERD